MQRSLAEEELNIWGRGNQSCVGWAPEAQIFQIHHPDKLKVIILSFQTELLMAGACLELAKKPKPQMLQMSDSPVSTSSVRVAGTSYHAWLSIII